MKKHFKAYLEITNCCNLNCAFCPGTKRKAQALSEEEFTVLINKLAPHTEYLYYHLMGEPTAHPLLPRFIEITNGLKIKPIITTNGTLLKARGAEILAAKPYKVNVSLHSFEANEKAVNFEEYVRGCLSFAKTASSSGVITVLRLWNLDGRAKGALNQNNGTVLEAIAREFPGEWKETRSGKKLCERVFLEWGEKFDWPDICGEIINESGFCYGLRDQVGVLCDGTVVPCCLDGEGKIALGNLFESTLEEIMDSPRARGIYDGFTAHRCEEELCKRCMRASYYRTGRT